MKAEHCDGNHEDMGCGCFCLKCNAVWDCERKLRNLAGFARALFYVCKAMGPPAPRGRCRGCAECYVRRACWWAWFDEAMPWVHR